MIRVERIDYCKPHWHERGIELAMVLSGEIESRIGCDSYLMKPGNILLIGTEDVHSFRKTEADNLILFISYDCRKWKAEFPEMPSWNLVGDPAVQQQSEEDFRILRNLVCKAALSDQENTHSLLLSFCRDSFLSTNLLLRKRDISSAQTAVFQKLTEYIESNYRNPITLGEIASSINYSFNHASLVIKQITGMNFTGYLNHIRCLAAERMLVSTDRTIMETALECGFSDARALGRYFRHWYGSTPGEFRRMLKQDFPLPDLQNVTPVDRRSARVISLLRSLIISECTEITAEEKSDDREKPFLPPAADQQGGGFGDGGVDTLKPLIEDGFAGRLPRLKHSDDISERLFSGCGLHTSDGIKKASGYLFDFISGYRSILRKEAGLILGRSSEGLLLLIYNPAQSKTGDISRSLRIILKMKGKKHLIKRMTIDNIHGNPHRLWRELGSPAALRPEERQLINDHSIPRLDFRIISGTEIELHEYHPACGTVMISITPCN